MSVDKYAKFISEQQKSMVNAGLAEAVDNVKLDTKEFDDIVEEIEVHYTSDDGDNVGNAKKLVSHLAKRGISAERNFGYAPHHSMVTVKTTNPRHIAYVKKHVGTRYDADIREGLELTSENYTHELDANDGHKMVADLKKSGFHAKIHKAVGPAGGAAVVHLGHAGGEKHVHSWIKKNYDEDHSKSDDMYKI